MAFTNIAGQSFRTLDSIQRFVAHMNMDFNRTQPQCQQILLIYILADGKQIPHHFSGLSDSVTAILSSLAIASAPLLGGEYVRRLHFASELNHAMFMNNQDQADGQSGRIRNIRLLVRFVVPREGHGLHKLRKIVLGKAVRSCYHDCEEVIG